MEEQQRFVPEDETVNARGTHHFTESQLEAAPGFIDKMKAEWGKEDAGNQEEEVAKKAA